MKTKKEKGNEHFLPLRGETSPLMFELEPVVAMFVFAWPSSGTSRSFLLSRLLSALSGPRLTARRRRSFSFSFIDPASDGGDEMPPRRRALSFGSNLRLLRPFLPLPTLVTPSEMLKRSASLTIMPSTSSGSRETLTGSSIIAIVSFPRPSARRNKNRRA